MQIVLEELQTTKQEKELLQDKLNETMEELENSKGLIEIHQAQHQSVSFHDNNNYKPPPKKNEVALWSGIPSSRLNDQRTEISVEFLRKMRQPAHASIKI